MSPKVPTCLVDSPRIDNVPRQMGATEEIRDANGTYNEADVTMRRRVLISGAIAASAALSLVIVGGNLAQALSGPATDSQLVQPAVTNSAGQFFTDAQIDKVWASVVSNYPQSLPPGSSFSVSAPAFFHPTDSTKNLFQAGLVDQIVENTWECDWLKYQLSSVASGDKTAAATAAKTLATRSTLPSIADQVQHDQDVKSYATHAGISDLAVAQYKLECTDGQ